MAKAAYMAAGDFRSTLPYPGANQNKGSNMKSKVLGPLAVALLAGPMSANAVLVGDLQQLSPTSVDYIETVDTGVFSYSATGDVTASVMAVDLTLGVGSSFTSGCEAADFDSFVSGSIALLQRGLCSFQVKAENAAAKGAKGVLIFNQSNGVNGFGLVVGTLGESYAGGIPVMGLTYALGAAFAETEGLVVRMFVREVVPEPGTLALLGLGLLGLGVSRRKQAA